jgi:hypothetical protein
VKLCFGVNVGATNYRSTLSGVQTGNPDPNFSQNVSLWIPNVGAGVYAYSDKFFVGVSVPHILSNSLSTKNKVWETGVLMLTSTYNFMLQQDMCLVWAKK